MKILPPGFEARAIDEARRVLDDIPHCREAAYAVRFMGMPLLPFLILAFTIPETATRPAFCQGLASMPSGDLLAGDRLRRALRTNIETYLHKCGVRLLLLEA